MRWGSAWGTSQQALGYPEKSRRYIEATPPKHVIATLRADVLVSFPIGWSPQHRLVWAHAVCSTLRRLRQVVCELPSGIGEVGYALPTCHPLQWLSGRGELMYYMPPFVSENVSAIYVFIIYLNKQFHTRATMHSLSLHRSHSTTQWINSCSALSDRRHVSSFF